MTEIRSPLGNMRFENTSAPPSTFTIPDETNQEQPGFDFDRLKSGQPVELTPEEFKQFRATVGNIQKEAQKTQQKVPKGAKERLQILLGLARKTRDVEIEGHIFSLKNLSSSETQEVTQKVARCDFDLVVDVMFETRIQTLAKAVEKIDGMETGLVLGIEAAEFFRNSAEFVVKKLYDEYAAMLDEIGIKSEAEAREVVDQIKK